MIIVDVPKLCGDDIISRTSGKILRQHLLDHWKEDKISLKFYGKEVRSSSFFDEAIALLVRDFDKEIKELQNKLEFPDLDAIDRALLNDTLRKRLKELQR
jgi:hypothetical protein